MSTIEIITEIKKLPLKEQIIVLKKIQESVKQKESSKLKKAAELLYENYKNDKELTAFTSLDSEDFYEAR